MQRLAHVAGVAYLNEEVNLNIHEIFGPWCAFRYGVICVLNCELTSSYCIYRSDVKKLMIAHGSYVVLFRFHAVGEFGTPRKRKRRRFLSSHFRIFLDD